MNGGHGIHCVECSSEGPTLLLLHGVTRNRRDWESLVPELTKRWRVVVMDHRGHGQSQRMSGHYRVVDYARATTDFVLEMFDEPLTIVGHSLGAMVALWLAAECHPLVKQVVLEDPPFHTMGNRIGDSPYLALFTGMQAIARHGGDVEQITDALARIRVPAPQGFVTLGDVRDRESLKFSASCIAEIDPAVFSPLVAGRWLDDFDYEAIWSKIVCPVLLLQGDPNAGGTFTNADMAIAQQQLTNCKCVRFDGIGHQIHSNCRDRFLEELTNFLG